MAASITHLATHPVTGTDWRIELYALTAGGHKIKVMNDAINNGQILTYRTMTEPEARKACNGIWTDVMADPESWVRLVWRP
jgi:hypothetical protein